MAVFTTVTPQLAQPLLNALGLGPLQQLRGISAGIENTNYFVTTDQGEFVLTVFERLSAQQLPFYLELMRHLAQRGIPVPEPRADAQGRILHSLAGKPAAVVSKLRGSHQLAPNAYHCEQLGAMLARMHLAAQDFALHQPNLRALPWWEETVPVVLPHLDAAQAELIQAELAFQQQFAHQAALLPRGPIHADLFRDNAMFEDELGQPGRERLSGLFDFYFAGVDSWLFDMAVCINDWCIDLASGRLHEERAAALVAAYEGVRPLSGAEHRLLPGMLRGAALRFWVSRLWDFHLPREASLLTPHDPSHFERVLRQRVQQPWHALATTE
ncbi:homoserine kinase [Roseateles sp. BYS180W]|uniref:Homoserine kinase n=1 Tax=Roseateles rivi TaxID=3299028 RepID=A0ABW7FXM6_9BURK